MEENVIKSGDVAPKKVRPPKEKTENQQPIRKEKFIKDKPQGANVPDGHKMIIFESGSSYTTKSGTRFTSKDRVKILPVEEADYLLSFVNFREPNALEVEDFNKKMMED
jgi:hypothetical protein